MRPLIVRGVVGFALVALTSCDDWMPTPPTAAPTDTVPTKPQDRPAEVHQEHKPPLDTQPIKVLGLIDPIIISDCRLTVVEKQDVPSQRDGVLLAACSEIKPGETVSPDRLVVVSARGQQRQYRRLKEGDIVEAGQLVALLDDRLARDDYAIKKGQIALTSADLAASERARDEAHDRYQTQMRLRSAPAGPATSEEDVASAKLLWYRYHCEAVSKKEAVALSKLLVHQAETVLATYEIRSAIPGVVKRIHKNSGEAVRALEPIVEVRNHARLRAEGMVPIQQLPRLREGLAAIVVPSRASGPTHTFTGHTQEVNGVAVGTCAHGPVVVSAGADGAVRVMNLNEGHASRVLSNVPAKCVACTTVNGANLCVAGCTDGVARIWNLDQASDAPVQEFRGHHRGVISCVDFSPNGQSCVSGGDDHQICLWDTANGALRCRFPAGHVGAITALQFPTLDRVISVGRDNKLMTWDISETNAKMKASLPNRSGDVGQLGASADGDRTLFDQGDTLFVMSLPRGLAQARLRSSGAGGFATFAMFSPDANWIVTAGVSEGRLQVWRAPANNNPATEVMQFVPTDRAHATCAAFSTDGSILVTGTRSGQVMVWKMPDSGQASQPITGQLTLVERSVESIARQVRVWAEFSNPDQSVIPGTTVTLVVQPSE